MIKKKNFILLEVLIAFSLVATAILPLLRFPYNNLRKEIHSLIEIELEKIAQAEIAKWEVKLYQKDPQLEKILFDQNVQKPKFQLSQEVEVLLSKKIHRSFTKKVTILRKNEKLDKDRNLWALIEIQIKFIPKGAFSSKNGDFLAKAKLVARKKV